MTNHWLYPITEFLLSCFKFPGGWLQQYTSTMLRQECRCWDRAFNPILNRVITEAEQHVVLALGQDVIFSVRIKQSMSTAYHRHSLNYMPHIHTLLPLCLTLLNWSSWGAGIKFLITSFSLLGVFLVVTSTDLATLIKKFILLKKY